MSDTKVELQQHCKYIADQLSGDFCDLWRSENGWTLTTNDDGESVWVDEYGTEEEEPEPESGWAGEWLDGVLDIEYVIGSDGDYRGARVLVAWGGPNIWVDFRRNKVEGFWGGDCVEVYFDDTFDICDYLEEYYDMSRS